MQKTGDKLLLSASDLVGHLACRHLTQLNQAVTRGELAAPMFFDPLLELLKERGFTEGAGHTPGNYVIEKAFVEK